MHTSGTAEPTSRTAGAEVLAALDTRPRILLVDDQRARLITYEAILGSLPVQRVCVASGHEALEQLLKQDFAAVLLDVNMPDMDGFEVARLIRDHPRLQRTPILFVTGTEVSALDQLKGYEVGAIDYISVPIVPEILRSKVAVLVELHQRHKELEELNRALQDAKASIDLRYASEMAHQRQLYEAILANTPDLAYVWDLNHRFVYANEGLLKMWGKTREEAIGKNCLELGYEPWHAAMHDREIDQIIATKRPVRGEVPFAGTFGRRYYDYLLVPVLGADGEVTAVAGTTRDITEQKELEASLRESDRRKDEFIAMLAHELRNPVAPIRNAGEILSRLATDERQTALADVLKRQTAQLSRLLDDLLEVARISQGRIELRREIVAIQTCVQMAVEAVEPMILQRHQRLEFTREGLSILVDADKARLTQCVANLLTNAAKFTPPGGDIRVDTRIENSDAVIEVSDTGIGIAAHLLPQLFELFVQGAQSLDRSEGGLGIGLSICKRLIEMQGGHVSGRSDGVGHGSTFTIRLPLSKAVPSPGKAVAEPADRKRCVLVVDDNRDAADSLATLLEIEGHNAKAAYSAEAALDEVATFQPELVFLDIGLPRISGYEVVRRIKGAYPLITVVALSGYGSSEDRQRVVAAGFDAHLVKPVDFDTLKQLMRRQNQ
ncbi:MAG TPA: response regulator [Steroidobacteraceae bacterium]|nr:response regulator [Steroidobacteraceae bacterium]